MLRDLVKGGLFLTISSVFVKLLSLLYIPILARVLGPENFGMYNLVFLLIPWFVMFSSFSMEGTMTKMIAEARAKRRSTDPYIRDSLVISMVFGAFFSLLFYAFSDLIAVYYFHDAGLGYYLKLISPAIFFMSVNVVFMGILRGFKQLRRYAFFEVVKQVLFVSFGLGLVVALNMGVSGAIVAILLCNFFIAVYVLFRYRHVFRLSILSKARGILSFSGSLLFLSIGLSVFFSMDKLFLGYFESKIAMGFYVSAFTIVGLLSMFTTAIRRSMFPFVTEAYSSGDLLKTNVYLNKTIMYLLMVQGFFLIFLSQFSYEVISLLYGEEYVVSAGVLSVLLYSVIFTSLIIIFHIFLVAVGKMQRTYYVVCLSVLFSFLVNYLFISNAGMLGAAYALLVNSFVFCGLYFFVVQRDFDVGMKNVLLIILIFGFMVGFSQQEGDFVYRLIVLGVSLSGYVAILLKWFISKEEYLFLKDKFISFVTI